MKTFKSYLTMPLLALLVVSSQAQAGVKEAGGGDICEDRIKTIRSDIHSWIQKGGAAGLSLPQGTSLEAYSQKMFESISDAKIRCVGRGDKGHPVQVYGTPKVCAFNRGPFSGATITCDRENFMKMGESDQYVLVHHEYAGLAGLEKPNKDDSEYSDQISAYLTQQTVLKLAVKSAPAPVPKKGKGAPCDQQVSFESEIVKPAIEKVLIPEVEKTLKKIYVTNGEKIKSIKSTYQWIEESTHRAYVIVHTHVINTNNLEDVFVTGFARSNFGGTQRIGEYIPEDALGRKYPPRCVAGIRFTNLSNSDEERYEMEEQTFNIFNASTKLKVGKMVLNSEKRSYVINFPR